VRAAVNARKLSVCLAVAALVGVRSAHAADPEEQKRSAELFKAGLAAGKGGDYARAEAAFRDSYALRPSASTLRNWAVAEMKLGKTVEALGHLRSAIGWTGWSAEQRRVVQENLDDAYAATGHLAIKTTDGAGVAVDGVVLEGSAPFDAVVDVADGKRQVEARLGTRVARAEVDAAAGKVVEVSVPLPVDAPPPVSVAPTASNNFVRVGTSTLPEGEASSTWWTPPHAVAVGLGATAAAGIGLGVYFDAASHAAASDAGALRASLSGGACAAATAPPQCGTLRDKIAVIHQDETFAYVSLAVGAAAAVGAVIVLAVVGPRATVRTGTVRWTPTIAPGAAGVAGAF
jgi:hypothetical protein